MSEIWIVSAILTIVFGAGWYFLLRSGYRRVLIGYTLLALLLGNLISGVVANTSARYKANNDHTRAVSDFVRAIVYALEKSDVANVSEVLTQFQNADYVTYETDLRFKEAIAKAIHELDTGSK
ncbi:MAG: hypothetical protein K1Y02_05730 [Candidatus Hydrogenedentes bacterium]|nr:hypothetical protein [Candidatus Hydrogenedentota bacterium]